MTNPYTALYATDLALLVAVVNSGTREEALAWVADNVKLVESDGPLYRWCPDCDGMGTISTMDTGPDLHETSHSCGRCVDLQGFVQIWPENTDGEAFGYERPGSDEVSDPR